jgi:hypothetical protein
MAVDRIRHERSLRPSHVEDVGGAELKNDIRVSNHWRRQSDIPQVELPTEIRKAELKRRMKASEQQLIPDQKFFESAWRIKNTFGPQREKALTKFWREVYKEEHHDDRRVFREFALNDYLEASDELHELEYPMRAPCTVGWR